MRQFNRESDMADLLSKITTYDLYNYLLTGIVFVVLASEFTHYSFVQQDIVLGLFLYYFIGLVISRFGSLVIEPILKWIKFLRFAEYKEFVVASKMDDKIALLSEVNNTYRTFCSLFTLLLLLKAYECIQARCPILGISDGTILLIFMLVIFLFSYRKQTNYVRKRVEIGRIP